jgi:hypothetical protein
MQDGKSSAARPMNVFVRPGSKAETICRRYAAGEDVAPKKLRASTEAIAAGFPKHPELNLRDHGGKIIQDLVFTNFYVGGDAWNLQDIQRIDTNLAKAMSDPHLNNVLLQYFRGAAKITSTFRPSTTLPGPAPAQVSQSQVEAQLIALHTAGKLANFDFTNTVFNFLLSPGTVLTTDDGGSDNKAPKQTTKGKGKKDPERTGEVEEAADSLHGLGGFHGSVSSAGAKLYYAVGAFSEGSNGIVAFDQPWKNVVATFYHELVEARTDADVAENRVAWVNNERPSAEIGDIPMALAGDNLGLVMKEVPLADGSGTVPIQLMWSNAVSGPEGPIALPHPSQHGAVQPSISALKDHLT